MNINLEATRVNNIDTTVSIEFSGINNENFQYVASHQIKNSKDEIAVIIHIKGDNNARIEPTSNDTVTFTADFEIEKQTTIRVFYWNDTDLLADNLTCFQDFLEKNGLDENVKVGNFDCEYKSEKSIAIPRQAGNGGVLGITDLPIIC